MAKYDINKRKAINIIAFVSVILIAVLMIWLFVIRPSSKFDQALSYYRSGDLEKAKGLFAECLDYYQARSYYDTIIAEPSCIYEYENDILVKTTLIEYDKNGKILKEECIGVKDESYNNVNSYEYDKKGFLVKKTSENKKGKTVTEYTHNINGLLLKEAEKSNDSTIVKEYTYNSDNKCVQMSCTGFDGLIVETYSYDVNGNVIKKNYSNYKDSEYTVVYVYNEYNMPTSEEREDKDGKRSGIDYSYKDGTRITEKTERLNATQTVVTTYEYDKNNNIRFEKSSEIDGVVKKTEYEKYQYFCK